MHNLIDKVEKFNRPRVLLVGDFILDRYVYGDVERINPEAPVPVLRIVRSQSMVGGAGNVAAAVPAMGAGAACVGVIGKDLHGKELMSLLEAAGADASGLIALDDRPTAVKTRYVGLAQHRHPQQMLRVDDEMVDHLPASVQQELLARIESRLPQCDVVILEDYNKGLFTPQFTPRIIELARKAGKSVMVDPARIDDFGRYRGATLLKPNRYEAALASGVDITDEATLDQAARRLMEITDSQAIVISLDREGMYLHLRDGGGKKVPHRCPRSVYDVTGAGDETLAVLAVAVAEGCNYEEAVDLANVAGGLEVEKFGFVPIAREELVDELKRLTGLRGSKVVSAGQLLQEIGRRRAAGQSIAFTNGCFDLLHMGHVRYLRQAREHGSCLVVAINSDDSVRRLKGSDRPVIGERERAEMLGALECVDYVVIFDEDTPIGLLEVLRPDVLVKGGSTPVVVGRELVESYGGKVMTMDLVAGMSTTQIIDRITSGEKPKAKQ